MRKRLFILWLIIGLPLPANAVDIDAYPALQTLVSTMVAEDGFTESELQAMLAPATINQKVLELMDRQWEALPWYRYRQTFINDRRIDNGVEFWSAHRDLLARAQQEYGVPPEIIVAIIGVETHYGAQLGNLRVLDSLVTLAAAYPRRSAFFSAELRAFLKIVRREGVGPDSIHGSFAGAIGIPQFMPSSYLAYAVDFNANNRSDLVNEVADAIGSVGKYLHAHGWVAGQKIFAAISLMPESGLPLVSRRAKPNHTLADIKAAGIHFDPDRGSQKAAVLQLTERWEKRYFVGYDNFYAITRYNPSVNYAMAITELAQEIKQRAED